MITESVQKRFTLLSHVEKPQERTWIETVFGPYIKETLITARSGSAKSASDTSFPDFLPHDCLVTDAFIHAQDPSRYSRFRGKNAFLIHFLDENYEGHYELYQNFKGVFRNFWSSVFNPEYVRALPLGPLAGVGVAAPSAAVNRRFVWSFIGQANKSTRVDAVRQLACIEPHFLFTTDTVPGFTSGSALSGSLPPRVYSELLGDSIFAPSPMGNVNLECYRVYDALECGAIPIVEKRAGLDYFRYLFGPHPLPTICSWAEAPGLIAAMLKTPEAVATLQRECLSWWASYQRQFTAQVGSFLALRSADTANQDRQMFEGRANSRWWQIRELLRHHNAPAVSRRVQLQTSRLLSGQGLRVAFRPGKPPD